MTPAEDVGRGDIEAALAARSELGAAYDAETVDAFADRIERAVERRAAEQAALHQRRTSAVMGAGGRQLALGIISLVVFIPISIVLGVNGELAALLLALAGIVGVNVAHAWQSRIP